MVRAFLVRCWQINMELALIVYVPLSKTASNVRSEKMIDLIKLLEYEDLRESHKKIVDCIGLEEFKTLVRYFDGKAFSVPKLQSIIPIIKRRIILEDFYIRKLSKNKIAEKHNVSIDYVNRIIYFSEAGQSEIRKANDDRQTRDQSIVHDYTQFHLSPNQIAEKYDLSPNRVRVILKEHDIFPSENHLISAEIKDKIIFDYSETDMTKSEIAKKYKNPDLHTGHKSMAFMGQ